MTCRTIDVDTRSCRFCPEDPPPPADRLRAVVRGRFLDELTGREIGADITVSTAVAGLEPRTGFGGVAGLVGYPRRLFPGLGAGSVAVDMTVSAARYVSRRFEETLGPVANFPDAFQPIDLGDIPMHRQSVALRGRVVDSRTTPRTPMAGVTVRVEGFWSTFPAPDVYPPNVVETPNLVSLQPGLYAQRVAGTDSLRRRDMVPAAGEEKILIRAARAGDSTLRISDRLNLDPGHILAIEPNHPDLAEYLHIVAVKGTATPDQPATVTLNFALAHDHAETSRVVRSTPQPAGLANALARDGIAGDGTVFLNALADLPTASIVEISGGADPEYQHIALYEGLSDAGGYYRLPPVSRVAQLELKAERAGLPKPVKMVVSPNYDRFEDFRDILF